MSENATVRRIRLLHRLPGDVDRMPERLAPEQKVNLFSRIQDWRHSPTDPWLTLTGRMSQRLLACIYLVFKDLLRPLTGCFLGATVRATARESRLFLWDFDFFVDQLHRLLTELREEMFVPFQFLALVAGMLCNHVVRHSLS